MKTPKTPFLIAISAFTIATGAATSRPAHAEGLKSSDSSKVSGTAGVRGGDVMGRAILSSHPSTSSVTRMENRRVSETQLNQFQKQGKIGRFAQ